jgi:hypothetical protein
MKKLLLLFWLVPVIASAQFGFGAGGGSAINTDSADFRALTVDSSRVLTEADTSEIPFEEQIGMTKWGVSDIALLSKLGGGDVIACNPFGINAPNNFTMSDSRARGSILVLTTDTTITGVGFSVSTAAVLGAATYDNFNGVAVYDADWSLLGQSANDGTIYNSTGLKRVDLTTPVQCSAGKIYIELLYNLSEAPTTHAVCRSISGYNTSDNWLGFELGYYRDSATGAESTITATITSTVPIFIVY